MMEETEPDKPTETEEDNFYDIGSKLYDAIKSLPVSREALIAVVWEGRILNTGLIFGDVVPEPEVVDPPRRDAE